MLKVRKKNKKKKKALKTKRIDDNYSKNYETIKMNRIFSIKEIINKIIQSKDISESNESKKWKKKKIKRV